MKNRMKVAMSKGRKPKILIVFLHGLGDNIMLTPSIRTLKKKYPNSFISVLVLKFLPTKDIWINNPHVDAVYESDFEYHPRYWNPFAFYLVDFWHIRKEVNKFKKKYGILIVYNPKIQLTLMQRIERNLFKRGKLNVLFRKIFLRRVFHKMDRIAKSLNVDLDNYKTEIFLTKRNHLAADKFLRDNKITKKDSLIGLHRTSPDIRKNWDIDEAQKFCDILIKRRNTKVIVFNSKKSYNTESLEGKHLQGKNIINAIDLDLLTATALIKKCKIFIGVDSGPGHIANAVGTPLISLFIGSPPEFVKPLMKKVFLIHSNKISAEEVLKISQKLFKNDAPAE